ncbi:TetR/AcrR family transcriptional regulator [Flindersiella endophytica]
MPRDTLTAERIVQAAIELLDAEGLDGLNLRALGKRLGSAATAVYWHVENKDNLVRLAVDSVWSEVELPDYEAVGWRTAATTMAASMHAMLTRHPWIGQAFGSYLIYGAGKARCDDHAMAIYEHAGFSPEAADQALATVFIFVLGSALGRAAEVSLARRLRKDGADPEQAMADTVAKAVEIGMAYPRLRQRLLKDPEPGYLDAPPDTFEYALATILDGLELRLTA